MKALQKEKTKTKSDYTCIVSVYLDKEYMYDTFDEIAKRNKYKIVRHEFDDFVLADEYCKTLQDMNQEFLGRFLYSVQYISTEISKNFIKTISLQPNMLSI